MSKVYKYKGKEYTSKKKLLESEGLKYLPSMKAMSRYDLDVYTYLQWVEEGRIVPNSFIFNGEQFDSMKDCVAKLLPEITLTQFYYKRRQLKISAKECLERFLSGEFDNSFYVKGHKFKSVEQCAKFFGYTYDELYSAYQNKKLDITIYEFLEKYFNGEIEHRLTRVTYNGIEYPSITKLIEEKGYNKAKFYDTKKRRNYEDSLQLVHDVDNNIVDISEVTVKNHYGFEFENKHYKSQKQFFEVFKNEEPKRFSQYDYFKLKKEKIVENFYDYLDYRKDKPIKKQQLEEA